MPTIVFASSKGGAGKTTAAVILASELARQGAPKGINIALIDADPNQHSAAWANKDGCPENIQLIENATEENILDAIDDAESNAAFVLVDLEGVASSAVIGAVSRADLVVIPCQPSQNDAKEAVKTIKTIQYSARVAGRKIPFTVLFTRLSAAIITKTGKHLAAEFDGAGIDLFECWGFGNNGTKNPVKSCHPLKRQCWLDLSENIVLRHRMGDRQIVSKWLLKIYGKPCRKLLMYGNHVFMILRHPLTGFSVPLFPKPQCSLIDREAFKSVFSYGGTVNSLEGSTKREQESIKKAAENAKFFAEEVKRKLKTSIEQKRAAANG